MKNLKVLILIFALALAVRATFFGNYFTGDAIDTVGPARNYAEMGRAAVYATKDTTANFGFIEDGLYFNFTHPPMRIILYSIWAVVFGFSTMILLPVLFGMLTLLFIYLIGKEMYSEKVGLIAVLIAAVIRYHFYASVIGFGDNFLMMCLAASFFFFHKYINKEKAAYVVSAGIFMALGFLTKFSAISMVPIFVVAAVLYSKKRKLARNVAAILIMSFVSAGAVYFSYPLVEHFTGVSTKEYDFFGSYVGISLTTAGGGSNFIQGKIFYLAAFAWQFTPFFAALIILALAKLRRDKNYLALAAWFLITFLIGFASNGQDFQRLMVIAIAPAIILVAKYVSDLKFSSKNVSLIFLGFLAASVAAYFTGLNDLLTKYSPEIVALFFGLAALLVFVPQNRQILLGASISLSIYFLIGTNFLVSINSSAVQQLTEAVKERGYPYYEVWSTRDISLYLAPEGDASFLQRPEPTENFIRENNVSYFAFYSIYEENTIINLSKLCQDEPFFASVNGRRVGLACRM